MNDERHNVRDDFEACTGCGSEAFACIVGNGDPHDQYHGPYALCEDAFREWLIEGDTVVLTHD
jgi:hypothetical protein